MILVTAGIIYRGKEILIARRSATKHLGGLWEFPGGKVEEGETEMECLKRELEEELGIVVDVGDFFMENEHQYGAKKILLKAYICEHVSGEFVLNDHDCIEWVGKERFRDYNFAPADVPFIDALLHEK